MPKIEVFEEKHTQPPLAVKHLKHLPFLHPNFRLIMVAPAGSGKTQVLLNLIFRDAFMMKLWKKTKGKTVMFIPSVDVCELIAKVAHKNKFKKERLIIYPSWNEEKCNQEYREVDPKHPNLFVFDDVAFLNFSSHLKKNVIDSIFCAGRHSNISAIITCQKYTHLNENVRANNASCFMLFFGLSKKELDRIYIEHLEDQMSQDKFKEIIDEYLNEQYKFIWIDKKTRKLYDNEFNEIDIKEKE